MTTSDCVSRRESSYLKFLPAIYRDNELIGQLLLIFESILSPIEHCVDGIPSYFDPLLTPDHFLPWLASWLGLSLHPSLPEDRRRELTKSAAELYRWRGTRRGMARYIGIFTGCEPDIHEYTQGMMLNDDTQMGSGAQLGSGLGWYHFIVVLPFDKGSKIEENLLRTIIEAQKPAHSTYSLQFRPENGE